jgi:hypothetical protein
MREDEVAVDDDATTDTSTVFDSDTAEPTANFPNKRRINAYIHTLTIKQR